MSRRGLVFTVAGLLLAALIGAWFFTSYERVDEEIDTGYQGAALSARPPLDSSPGRSTSSMAA